MTEMIYAVIIDFIFMFRHDRPSDPINSGDVVLSCAAVIVVECVKLSIR